jgi:hypothetical protein
MNKQQRKLNQCRQLMARDCKIKMGNKNAGKNVKKKKKKKLKI